MNLIQESYQRLFPDQEMPFEAELSYNRKLSDFNANVRKSAYKIEIHLNLQWKDIDDEIKIGLIQHLLLKILKQKKNSPNIELYHNFVRNIPILTPKTQTESRLEQSFNRVNEKLFQNQMEKPNLSWGQDSRRKLASYNFHGDIITVSTLFQNASSEILDYLMYHELLHKQQKFRTKNGRSFYHTSEFREAENLYPNKDLVEKEINKIIRGYRKKRSFFSRFF